MRFSYKSLARALLARAARHGFHLLSGGSSGVSVRPAQGEDVSKIGRSAALAPTPLHQFKTTRPFGLAGWESVKPPRRMVSV